MLVDITILGLSTFAFAFFAFVLIGRALQKGGPS